MKSNDILLHAAKELHDFYNSWYDNERLGTLSTDGDYFVNYFNAASRMEPEPGVSKIPATLPNNPWHDKDKLMLVEHDKVRLLHVFLDRVSSDKFNKFGYAGKLSFQEMLDYYYLKHVRDEENIKAHLLIDNGKWRFLKNRTTAIAYLIGLAYFKNPSIALLHVIHALYNLYVFYVASNKDVAQRIAAYKKAYKEIRWRYRYKIYGPITQIFWLKRMDRKWCYDLHKDKPETLKCLLYCKFFIRSLDSDLYCLIWRHIERPWYKRQYRKQQVSSVNFNTWLNTKKSKKPNSEWVKRIRRGARL